MPICTIAYEFLQKHLNQNSYNYLEIGIFDGSGPCALARAFPNKKIYIIDPFVEDGYTIPLSGIPEKGRLLDQRYAFFKSATGLDNIIPFEMPSFYFLEKIKKEPELIEQMNIGTVFIDGSHHYSDVIIDCEIADMVLNTEEGFVVFDDNTVPDVNKAILQFRKTHKNRIVGEEALNHDVLVFILGAK